VWQSLTNLTFPCASKFVELALLPVHSALSQTVRYIKFARLSIFQNLLFTFYLGCRASEGVQSSPPEECRGVDFVLSFLPSPYLCSSRTSLFYLFEFIPPEHPLRNGKTPLVCLPEGMDPFTRHLSRTKESPPVRPPPPFLTFLRFFFRPGATRP